MQRDQGCTWSRESGADDGSLLAIAASCFTSSAMAERMASKSLQDQRPCRTLANISEAHGPSFVSSRATCELLGQMSLEDIFFREFANTTDPTGGTLRSSVVHSAGRASTIPLAWLAAQVSAMVSPPATSAPAPNDQRTTGHQHPVAVLVPIIMIAYYSSMRTAP